MKTLLKIISAFFLNSKYQKGKFKELFSNTEYVLKGDDIFTLAPWKYLILVKEK